MKESKQKVISIESSKLIKGCLARQTPNQAHLKYIMSAWYMESDTLDKYARSTWRRKSSPGQNQNPCTTKQARLMNCPENKIAPEQRWDWSPWLGEIRLPNSIRRSDTILTPARICESNRSGIERKWYVLGSREYVSHPKHATRCIINRVNREM